MNDIQPKPQVAFIGLGMMGFPMASRLVAAGFPLAVYDRDGDAVARFATAHACRTGASAADTVRGARFAITMLPGSPAVAATLTGGDGVAGILETLAPGAYLIDMSSSEPLSTRQLATAVAQRGATMIDAPVSGGVRKAKDGTLAIMVGGAAADVAHCRTVLGCMGATLFHTGGIGSGHAMKALNNYVSAAGLVAAVEALHIGAAFGLDPATVNQVLNASTGRNNTTENKVAQFMLSGTYASGFSLDLMVKDIGIAIDLADGLEISAAVGHAVLDTWRRAQAAFGKGLDHTEMYRALAPERTGRD
jgi:3-hydroxyisobutyrate dehydrogenase